MTARVCIMLLLSISFLGTNAFAGKLSPCDQARKEYFNSFRSLNYYRTNFTRKFKFKMVGHTVHEIATIASVISSVKLVGAAGGGVLAAAGLATPVGLAVTGALAGSLLLKIYWESTSRRELRCFGLVEEIKRPRKLTNRAQLKLWKKKLGVALKACNKAWTLVHSYWRISGYFNNRSLKLARISYYQQLAESYHFKMRQSYFCKSR